MRGAEIAVVRRDAFATDATISRDLRRLTGNNSAIIHAYKLDANCLLLTWGKKYRRVEREESTCADSDLLCKSRSDE